MNTINVEAGDMGLVIAFVLMLGGIIKNYTPIDNKFIPLITWVLGGLLYQWLAGGWTDPRQWMMALLSVAGATGLHSATRSALEKPAAVVGLILLLLLPVGCATTAERLETGGAYAASATQAAQPELFALDASFDLAYSGLDAAFKYERANRAALWALSPAIKRGMDKLRRAAGIVKGDYALARSLYLENPTPAGLGAVQEALNKLQLANVAALQVIEKKGQP